jgi:hypothetical protein
MFPVDRKLSRLKPIEIFIEVFDGQLPMIAAELACVVGVLTLGFHSVVAQ